MGIIVLQAGGLMRKGTFPMCSSRPLVHLAPFNPTHALGVLLLSLVTQHLNLKPAKGPGCITGPQRGLACFKEEVEDFARIQ